MKVQGDEVRALRSNLRSAQEINEHAVNRRVPIRPRSALPKIICQFACRLKKGLIAECMIVRTAAVYRDLEKRNGQNRFSYRGCYIGRESALVAGTCKSGEWSNRRWRSGRTYRRCARRPGPRRAPPSSPPPFFSPPPP